MDNEIRLMMAGVSLQKQDLIIRGMIATIRPFAKAANAQMHTDCGGHIKQSDWEQVAQMVAAADRDTAVEILRDMGATRAH